MADDTPVLGEPARSSNSGAAPQENNRGNFTRNLNTEPDEAIARKMFFGGLALLPWLHAVNVIHYRKQFLDPSIDPKVTLCTSAAARVCVIGASACMDVSVLTRVRDCAGVRRSCLSFVFVTILFVSWVVLFQLKWEDFGWAKLVMVLPAKNLDRGW